MSATRVFYFSPIKYTSVLQTVCSQSLVIISLYCTAEELLTGQANLHQACWTSWVYLRNVTFVDHCCLYLCVSMFQFCFNFILAGRLIFQNLKRPNCVTFTRSVGTKWNVQEIEIKGIFLYMVLQHISTCIPDHWLVTGVGFDMVIGHRCSCLMLSCHWMLWFDTLDLENTSFSVRSCAAYYELSSTEQQLL